jgi:Entner-Doudoroff aldolase
MRALLESRVVAILRLRDHGLALEVAEALARGGVRVLELTQDDPGALEALRAVAALGDVVVGAGTVLDPATVPVLADAGARFIVSPHTDAGVIGAALDAGLDPIPGALTATEVASAIQAGATLVKLFPAGPLGTAYLRALRGPFGGVDFVPTGGIAHDAVAEWLEAGAAAVGLGSDLVPARPADADLEGIEARARVAVRAAT